MKRSFFLIAFLLSTVFLVSPVAGDLGPIAYMEENVESYYYPNGSIHQNDRVIGTLDQGMQPSHCIDNGEPVYPCRYGLLDVAVPNSNDVLQDVRVELDGTGGTNLDSTTTYKGALTSHPEDWRRSRLNVNTTEDEDESHYEVTDTDAAPHVELWMEWENIRGGEDLFSSTDKDEDANTVSVTVYMENPSTETVLEDMVGMVELGHDTEEGTAVANIDEESVTCPEEWVCNVHDLGYEEIQDDFFFDMHGTLEPGGVSATFEMEMEGGEHFSEEAVSVELDSLEDEVEYRGFRANKEFEDDTLTGLGVNDKFSRGPIRQGTDLAEKDETAWNVRGLVKNLAEGLTYHPDGWALYEVEEDGTLGEQVQEDNFDTPIGPGEEAWTSDADGWYTHESEEKPYYALEFDWHVMWNDTNDEQYFSEIESSLDMPELHLVKMAEPEKNIAGTLNPDIEGDPLEVTDPTVHTGSDEAPAREITINSVVPGKTEDDESPSDKGEDDDTFFEINETEGFEAWYYDDEEVEVNITDDVGFEFEQPTPEGDDGYVELIIDDFENEISANHGEIDGNLGPDESVELRYEIFSNYTMDEGDAFHFTGETTYVTESGTDYTREHAEETVTVAAKRLTGFKDLFAADPENPTEITGEITVEVIDESEDEGGIEEIEFMDYMPLGVEFDKDNVDMEIYDPEDEEWETFTNYEITYVQDVILPDGTEVGAYRYYDGNDGWTLYNGEKIRASYTFEITEPGVYEMPATIAGFDPTTGTELGTSTRGLHRLELPEPTLEMDINKGRRGMVTRPEVGYPVEWMKPVDVYNPNSRPTDEEFEVDVPRDTERAWAIYTHDGETKTIEGTLKSSGEGKVFAWEDEVPALESRRYEVRLLTPPVSEVDRSVEVLEELPGEMVKLKMDISLRNFAGVDYDEVLMNLPIPEDNVIEAADTFGEEIRYTGTRDTTTLIIEDVPAEDLKTLTLTYKQPYPTIIVTPGQDVYEADGPVDLHILVINGGEKIDNPRVELALYTPEMRAVSSEIKELDSLEPLEETELTESYVLEEHIPEGEYLAEVRFREDFATLATGTGKFYVESAFGPRSPVTVVLILLALAGASYISYKRIQSVRTQEV